MDPYKAMINQSDFAAHERLERILCDGLNMVQNEIDATERVNDMQPVEGLAVVYNGLTQAIVDIPRGGRAKVTHPRPAFVALKATAFGYHEEVVL